MVIMARMDSCWRWRRHLENGKRRQRQKDCGTPREKEMRKDFGKRLQRPRVNARQKESAKRTRMLMGFLKPKVTYWLMRKQKATLTRWENVKQKHWLTGCERQIQRRWVICRRTGFLKL